MGTGAHNLRQQQVNIAFASLCAAENIFRDYSLRRIFFPDHHLLQLQLWLQLASPPASGVPRRSAGIGNLRLQIA
jgi:hypothetical protein